MEICNLFPTPIGIFQFDRDFTSEELAFIDSQPTHSNAGNATSNDYYLYRHDALRSIHDFINASIKIYVGEVYAPKPSVNVRIIQSWLNYTKPGGFHHRHTHPNSFVSGAFYIKADSDNDRIHFFKDNFYQNIHLIPTKFTAYNTDESWISVKKGQLIIFPSRVMHSVMPVQNERCSLGFNAFPAGQVGFDEGITDIL